MNAWLGLPVALLMLGCQTLPPRPTPIAAADTTPREVVIRYEVSYRDGDLDIEARMQAGLSKEAQLSGPALGQVESLVYGAEGFSYRIHLRALCERGDRGLFRAGEVLFGSASRWLIRPAQLPRGRILIHVSAPAPIRFVSGMSAVPGEADTYQAPTEAIDVLTYSAFGPYELSTISLGDARVHLAIPAAAADPAIVRAWAERATQGVAAYFGRFPLPEAAIILLPVDGKRIVFGSALGNGGAAVQVMVGRDTPPAGFDSDWILTHETIHLGFPNLGDDHRWLEEGLATYLEPIIRARQGIHTEVELWRELKHGFSQGVLGAQEPGYEESQSWAHVYWGGAFFFFLADLEIRSRTENARSLADALVGIQADGGDIRTDREVERMFQVADRATGVEVLGALYQALGQNNARAIDLPKLLEDLGVVGEGEALHFNEQAPHAWLRRAILGRPR
ncbi:MAG: hypothetical protein U1E65_09315 [Myxococcota bacterium]